MGVSGSGKSAIGTALADELNLPFIDADDLHPASNIEKMRNGIPLTDEDRWPWLEKVGHALEEKKNVVIACSALKERYRDHIRNFAPNATFLLLAAPTELLEERVASRPGHYMPPSLLASQLEALEPLRPAEKGIELVNVGELEKVVATALASFRE